jgi:MFS family permease
MGQQGVAASEVMPVSTARRWRVLLAGCLAHITHDGFTDMLYLFFPIWQQTFHLSFAGVGLLKASFSGAMSGFQFPSGLLARRLGILRVLLLGTLLTSVSMASVGFAQSAAALMALLFLAGLGSSTQHPLASSAISNTHEGKASRVALSTYNFSGDIGKLIVPGSAALLVSFLGWRHTISTIGLCGLVAAALIVVGLRNLPLQPKAQQAASLKAFSLGSFTNLRPFLALCIIAILDCATRMGFLTFMPFVLRDKGAAVTTIGLALSLVFAGGAFGKFVCGVLATRVGILTSVIVTELATSGLIWGMISLGLKPALILCPLVGIALNGTSSVLYGSVPELVPQEYRNEAFAVFYTCGIGSGAVSPFLFGMLSDVIGVSITLTLIAGIVLLTLPMTIPLRGKLARQV